MKDKKIHLEFVRVFAIFFVLYGHSGISAKFHYQIAGGIVSEMISFALLCITMTCNSLFFMVTGAVLLHKNERVIYIFRHRVLKMVAILFIFSLFQYTYNYFKMPEIGFSIPVILNIIYSSSVITPYWFLYTYIALLMILPFLRIMARGMTHEHFIYLILLCVIFDGILPFAEYFLQINSIHLSIPMIEGILIFPLIGYYIEHNKEDYFDSKKTMIIINAASVAALLIDMFYARFRYYNDNMPEETLYGLMLLMALAVFVDFRYFCRHVQLPDWLRKVILFLGGGSFTVYLFNPQLSELCYFFYDKLEPYIKWLPATIVWLFAAIFLGGILAFLWHSLQRIVKNCISVD